MLDTVQTILESGPGLVVLGALIAWLPTRAARRHDQRERRREARLAAAVDFMTEVDVLWRETQRVAFAAPESERRVDGEPANVSRARAEKWQRNYEDAAPG